MRFYDIDDQNAIQRIESSDIFPGKDEEAAVSRCIRMGLVPSVTSILGIIREEYLEKWFMREAIQIWADKGGEHKDAVTEVFSRESPNAMFGTSVHEVGEVWMKREIFPIVEDAVRAHAAPMLKWFEKNVKRPIFAERLLGSRELRTAGSADFGFEDMSGRLVLADLKVVKFSTKFPPKPGLGYRAQLAAYKEMLRESTGDNYHPVSLYLASPFGWDKHPAMRVFEYGDKDYLPAFKSARDLWEAHATLEPLECINPAQQAATVGTFDPGKRKL